MSINREKSYLARSKDWIVSEKPSTDDIESSITSLTNKLTSIMETEEDIQMTIEYLNAQLLGEDINPDLGSSNTASFDASPLVEFDGEVIMLSPAEKKAALNSLLESNIIKRGMAS